jgi:hypothetical protein
MLFYNTSTNKMFIILVLTYVKIDKCCWSQFNIRAATDDSSKIFKFSYNSYLLLKLQLPLFCVCSFFLLKLSK